MDDDETGESRGWLLPALLAVVLAGVLVVGVALWRDHAVAVGGPLRAADVRGTDVQDGPDDGTDGGADVRTAGDAVRVARQAARRLFTLDHRRVDADLLALQALATDEFREEYADQSAELRRRVEARRLVISAQVPSDGIATEYLTADSAQVLVAVDVTSVAPDARASRRDYVTRVDLERVDDRWRVAGIEQVR